ncbi:MAG: hypothetical protein QOH61_1155 [Chloroflexota bacterium]|jgi:hypothetical protein|nr:hypothetical protein [Chloroflexota bacterium]
MAERRASAMAWAGQSLQAQVATLGPETSIGWDCLPAARRGDTSTALRRNSPARRSDIRHLVELRPGVSMASSRAGLPFS